MQKRKFDIKISLITATAIFVFSHAVIPHDHHTDFNHHEKHHNKDNQDSEPIHCFFFNDIISDNKTPELFKPFDKIPLNYSSGKEEHTLSYENFGISFKIFFPKTIKTEKEKILIKNIPVRGSPAFV